MPRTYLQHRRYTVGVLQILINIDHTLDDPSALDRCIDYTGKGWYSLGDDKIYRRNRKPTYSRIRVG
jgi:hypothetical protein